MVSVVQVVFDVRLKSQSKTLCPQEGVTADVSDMDVEKKLILPKKPFPNKFESLPEALINGAYRLDVPTTFPSNDIVPMDVE